MSPSSVLVYKANPKKLLCKVSSFGDRACSTSILLFGDRRIETNPGLPGLSVACWAPSWGGGGGGKQVHKVFPGLLARRKPSMALWPESGFQV